MNDIKDEIDEMGEKARNVPVSIRVVLFATSMFFTLYWIFTFSGPYAWISNLQAKLLGGDYYPMLSFLLTLIIALLPIGFIVQYLARTKYKDENSDQ